MGTCCSSCYKRKSPKQQSQKQKKDRFKHRQEYRVFTENHFVKKDELTCNLQHISEREPDCEKDPSLHPTIGPLFMQRSKSEMKISRHKKKSQINLPNEFKPLKKSNSCSTIFIDDSTVSHPHLTNTIKCVTLAIYYHIKNRTSNNVIDIFDERIHPYSKNPKEQDIQEPDHRMIYRCVKNLFFSAHLSPECAIITLVYLERLLMCAEIDIVPCTWKRIILGAILLASKVWDDQSVWNADFCLILKDITVEDINELERHFLEYIQFNINVPSSVYAKYYFGLRQLADQNNLNFPVEALSKERALEMEAMSKVYQDKTLYLQSNFFRMSCSAEDVSNNIKTRAILS